MSSPEAPGRLALARAAWKFMRASSPPAKPPTRLAIALGVLLTGGMAIAGELSMSHPLHQAIILAGGTLLFLIRPNNGGPPR